MQQTQKTGEQGVSQERVVAALTKLSTLALQTSKLHFSSPGTADRLAAFLLDQLVALCGAQQGALFLTYRHDTPLAEPVQGTVPRRPSLSLVARMHLGAEEAQAALASAASVPAVLRVGEELPAILSWERSLETSLSYLVHADQAVTPLVSQASAVLLFVWPFAERRELQDQAIRLLPLLADLVDTILQHLHAALHEGKQSAELFPAELLATVGHEFRGPLTTIQGYATTLLRHDQQLEWEERQDFLRAINEASTHLSKLVGRFLELAQFEARAHIFVPTSVDLLRLAQESLHATQKSQSHRLLLKPLRRRGEASASVPDSEAVRDDLTVSGDRRLLRTMLDILLENAVAYSASRSLVEVSLEPMDAASVQAALRVPTESGKHLALILSAHFKEHEPLLALHVQDHGIGISPEYLSLIFRRFYRVDTSLTREVNGLGLGLALCKAIVALHRGMLWVESAVGEGSIFSIVLPRGEFPELHGRVEA